MAEATPVWQDSAPDEVSTLMLRMMRPAIVVLWVWLLYQQYAIPVSVAPTQPIAAPVAVGGDTFMGVYIGEHKVGYSRLRRIAEESGYRFEEQSLLRLTALGTTQTVRSEMKGSVDGSYALRSLDVSVKSGVGTLEATGQVEQGVLELTMRVNGEESHQRVAVPNGLYVPSLARERLVHSGLRVGQELSTEVFDPSSLQSHPLHLRVASLASEDRDPRHAVWKVTETFRGLMTSVWIDAEGRVVREEGPMGFVAVRESAEQALSAGWQAGQPFDLVAAVAVPVHGTIVDPRNVAWLELRVTGPDGWSVPTDIRQQVAGDHVVVTREAGTAGRSFALPYHDAQWQSELSATAFLQSDHPRIRATAAAAVAGETDARRAVDRLRQWVFTQLRKVPTASIPNALQALAMGQGDCNEHAVLFAALARATGVPARVVAGTVYVDEAFLYHAWNEVWLGDTWVSLDTTMDQMPVDASHVKLLEGGPEEHAALLPLLGNLSVDVIASK